MHRAAVALVAEHGLAAVTTDMIAEAAGVSARTFFNYWASKDEAVLGVVHDRADHARELLEERPLDEDPATSLRHVLGHLVEGFLDEPDLRAAKKAVLAREPHLMQASGRAMMALQTELISALAERLVAQGDEDPEFRALVTVQLAVAASRCAFAVSMRTGRPVVEELERVHAAIDVGAVRI